MKEKEVTAICKKHRAKLLPDADGIVKEAFAELNLDKAHWAPDEALEHFNDHLFSVFGETLVVLEKHEKDVYTAVLKEIAERRRNEIVGKDVGDALVILYDDLWTVMQSRSQSRKSRGGSDFELELQGMLDLCEIPYTAQATKERTDLILPSQEFFKKDKTKAIVVSAKRTLRERWREVVEELQKARSPNVYLAVAETSGGISAQKVDDIWAYSIHLLVWDELKEKDFPDHPGVMGYSQFANAEIPALRRHWPGQQPKASRSPEGTQTSFPS